MPSSLNQAELFDCMQGKKQNKNKTATGHRAQYALPAVLWILWIPRLEEYPRKKLTKTDANALPTSLYTLSKL